MIVADTSAPSQVYGVHGTRGLTFWKCLARRADTHGTWEAAEWASLPPGGVSGEHLHTRTEEIYYILAGQGELVLDGARHPVEPGSIALTRTGSTHGLRNVGDGDLDWLVIEMSTPRTHAVLLSDGRIASQENPMARSVLSKLPPTISGSIDPATAFDGPLSAIRTHALTPDERLHVLAAGAEHVLYVLGGSGSALGGDVSVPLAPGTCVTLPLGTDAELVAAGTGLYVFQATLDVLGGQR